MIKKFDEYNLDREIYFLFDNSNESILDFRNKLLNLLPKIVSKSNLENFISRFFKYLKGKKLEFKKLAMSAFMSAMVFNTGFDIQDVDKLIGSNIIAKKVILSDKEIARILEEERINAMFKEYKVRANAYLKRDKWKGTPLTGEMFAKGAKKAYKKHGVLVPVELALAQAQFESHFGTKGLSPKNNPFNVGEYDSHTELEFNSPQEGIDAYFNVMSKDYLKDKTVDELLDDFVNYNGNRYASNENYEKTLKSQISYNKRWIDKNLKDVKDTDVI